MTVQRTRVFLTRRVAMLAIAAITPLAYLMFGGDGSARVPAATAQYVGGTADVALAQEPSCLNPYHSNCSLSATSRVANLVLPGAYRQEPNLAYVPRLATGVVGRSQSITYTVQPQAEWSDGVPVSADDLIFTFQTIMNPANQILSRVGYELITQSVKVDAKTVRFVFSRPYPPWKTLFPSILPKHVLEGHDFDTVWDGYGERIVDPDTNLPIGSGPFLNTGWITGSQVEFSRNTNWWGPHLPFVDAIRFRVVFDTTARFNGLTSGTYDVLDEPGLSAQATALYSTPGIVADWYGAGGIEHVMFRTTSTTMPLLQQPWFREAVAYAIDRAASVSTVYGTDAPGMAPHQSLIYLSQQAEYKENFARYQHDAAKVASLMTSHGCVLGLDGIYVCGGTRASLRFGTTTGNVARAQMQDQLQAQAQAAGIELVDDNFSSAQLGTRLTAGDFDLIMFQFLRSGDPFGEADLWGCGGAQNYSQYCSRVATQHLRAADRELSPSYRAHLVNRADSGLAGGLPAIPLFQRAAVVAHRDELHGVVATAAVPGVTWNAEDWEFEP